MRIHYRADDDRLVMAEAPADLDLIPFADDPMGLGVLAIDLDFAALARALGFRPRLEQTRDVEPDVQSNGF